MTTASQIELTKQECVFLGLTSIKNPFKTSNPLTRVIPNYEKAMMWRDAVAGITVYEKNDGYRIHIKGRSGGQWFRPDCFRNLEATIEVAKKIVAAQTF